MFSVRVGGHVIVQCSAVVQWCRYPGVRGVWYPVSSETVDLLRRQVRRPTARRTMAASSMDREPVRTSAKGEFSPSSEATEAENELMVSRTMPSGREHPVRMGRRWVELRRCFSGNARCMQDKG